MTTVAKKVTKKDTDTLFNAVGEYLQLNEMIASYDKQKEALKDVAKSIIDRYPHLIEDGEVVLEGIGRIVVADNAPKLFSLQSGNALVPAEAAGLLKVIGKQYEIRTIAVGRVSDAIKANNADLIAKLAEQEVALVQESRLDIKKPLKKMTDVEAMTILRRR